MKKIKSLVCIMCITFFLVSCSGNPFMQEKPEEVSSKFLKAAKEYNYKDIEKYSVNSELFTLKAPSVPGIQKEVLEEEMLEYNKKILSYFEYEIISSDVDTDKALINVKTKTLDFAYAVKNVTGDISSYLLNSSFSGEQLNGSEVIKLIKTGLNGEINRLESSGKYISKDININMEKTDSGWKVIIDKPLLDALYGGILSANEEMETPLKKIFDKVK